MELANIDAGRTIYAGIDPSYGGRSEIDPKAPPFGETQGEERSQEEIQEQNDPAPELVDQEAASGIAEERCNRLHEHEGDRLRQRDSPRSWRIVGSMKMMPFEDHKKPNETTHRRMVRLRRP